MPKRIVAAAFLAALLSAPFAVAQAETPGSCSASYYKTKSSACVDDVVGRATNLPAHMRGPSSDIVGFLGEVFRVSPKEKQRVLSAEADRITRAVEIMSLHRAGLDEDASRLATESGLSGDYERLRAARLPTIAAAKPTVGPGENDLLIGAYSASGERNYLTRILDNFNGVDDTMAADAMRLASLLGKFGQSFAPKDHRSTIVANACAKYSCKADRANFMRLLTLTTGLWAVRSVAANDTGAKAVLDDFFTQRPKLKATFVTEQNAFGNYLTLLIPLMTLKDDAPGTNQDTFAAMKASVDAYERLEPANAVLEPMLKLKKPQ